MIGYNTLAVIEMKQTLYFIILTGLLSCQNSEKKVELKSKDCNNTKLVSYIYPISNFTNEKTFVYSLKSNSESKTELFKKRYSLKVDKDSLLFSVTENSQGIVTDSTIFTLTNGIPKVLESFTRVDVYPELLPTKDSIVGNRFCEFGTFGNSFEYEIPFNGKMVSRKFQGHTTHKEYVKKVFNGIEYNCAIMESRKTLTAEFNGQTEKLNGTWTGCTCEGLGELYSTTKTENGMVIEHKLEEIIE
ncbi:hypothetical protein E1J38_013525 [Seonamhaeicola sediminis]|uniref:Uncharacterized protein n=2 Tax=Seonamhaeicola sediminis TaxID=2528206 RepID=A0A562YBV3_9FLAO|nr:hypothetical protein E1J38_013525 [Seonamhaeicola sediminis]